MKKALKIITIVVITFVGFYFLTDRFPRTSARVSMNCSDVAGFYEPCARNHKIYGFPFEYASGYTYIPGPDDQYYKSDVRPLIFIADYLIIFTVVYGVVRGIKHKRK